MRKRREKKRARHSAGQHHGGIFWCSGHWTGHGSVGSERPVRTLPAGINDERRTKKKSRRWGGSASPVAIGMSLLREVTAAVVGFRRARPELAPLRMNMIAPVVVVVIISQSVPAQTWGSDSRPTDARQSMGGSFSGRACRRDRTRRGLGDLDGQ